MATKSFKMEDPKAVREREEKERIASEKRKRLEELKLKDKLAQFETLIKNMGQKIETLEENNNVLKKELAEQEKKITRYVSNIARAKLASEGVRKEGDDEKTSFEKAGKRLMANSYYGGGTFDPFAENPNLIKKITDCRTLEDLYRFNPDPDMTSEKYGDALPAFDKPNKINSDQYAVNLAMGNTYWKFKRFFAIQSTKEIYIPMEESSSTKYLVIDFVHKIMRYSIVELFTDPKYPDPAHFVRKEVYTCEVKMNEEPTFIYVNTGNWVIKNIPTMGKNFCLYVDFLKWRVSMYRYEASSNSWVIHDFIELVRGMEIDWAKS